MQSRILRLGHFCIRKTKTPRLIYCSYLNTFIGVFYNMRMTRRDVVNRNEPQRGIATSLSMSLVECFVLEMFPFAVGQGHYFTYHLDGLGTGDWLG